MNRIRKPVTLLLSLIIVFGVLSPAVLAVAEDNVAQPRYLRISSFDTLLKIDSSRKSTCFCKVVTYYEDTINLTMELQRLEDTGWKTIKTWTGSGTGRASLDKDWYVSAGYEYRIKVVAEIFDSDGTLLETQLAFHPD